MADNNYKVGIDVEIDVDQSSLNKAKQEITKGFETSVPGVGLSQAKSAIGAAGGGVLGGTVDYVNKQLNRMGQLLEENQRALERQTEAEKKATQTRTPQQVGEVTVHPARNAPLVPKAPGSKSPGRFEEDPSRLGPAYKGTDPVIAKHVASLNKTVNALENLNGASKDFSVSLDQVTASGQMLFKVFGSKKGKELGKLAMPGLTKSSKGIVSAAGTALVPEINVDTGELKTLYDKVFERLKSVDFKGVVAKNINFGQFSKIESVFNGIIRDLIDERREIDKSGAIQPREDFRASKMVTVRKSLSQDDMDLLADSGFHATAIKKKLITQINQEAAAGKYDKALERTGIPGKNITSYGLTEDKATRAVIEGNEIVVNMMADKLERLEVAGSRINKARSPAQTFQMQGPEFPKQRTPDLDKAIKEGLFGTVGFGKNMVVELRDSLGNLEDNILVTAEAFEQVYNTTKDFLVLEDQLKVKVGDVLTQGPGGKIKATIGATGAGPVDYESKAGRAFVSSIKDTVELIDGVAYNLKRVTVTSQHLPVEGTKFTTAGAVKGVAALDKRIKVVDDLGTKQMPKSFGQLAADLVKVKGGSEELQKELSSSGNLILLLDERFAGLRAQVEKLTGVKLTTLGQALGKPINDIVTAAESLATNKDAFGAFKGISDSLKQAHQAQKEYVGGLTEERQITMAMSSSGASKRGAGGLISQMGISNILGGAEAIIPEEVFSHLGKDVTEKLLSMIGASIDVGEAFVGAVEHPAIFNKPTAEEIKSGQAGIKLNPPEFNALAAKFGKSSEFVKELYSDTSSVSASAKEVLNAALKVGEAGEAIAEGWREVDASELGILPKGLADKPVNVGEAGGLGDLARLAAGAISKPTILEEEFKKAFLLRTPGIGGEEGELLPIPGKAGRETTVEPITGKIRLGDLARSINTIAETSQSLEAARSGTVSPESRADYLQNIQSTLNKQFTPFYDDINKSENKSAAAQEKLVQALISRLDKAVPGAGTAFARVYGETEGISIKQRVQQSQTGVLKGGALTDKEVAGLATKSIESRLKREIDSYKQMLVEGGYESLQPHLQRKAKGISRKAVVDPDLAYGEVRIHKDDLRLMSEVIGHEIKPGEFIESLRYPTTGAESFVTGKVVTTEDDARRDTIGLSGFTSFARLKEQYGNSEGLKREVDKLIEVMGVAGKELDGVFHHVSQNLDFDGDTIHVIATQTAKSQAELETHFNRTVSNVEDFADFMQEANKIVAAYGEGAPTGKGSAQDEIIALMRKRFPQRLEGPYSPHMPSGAEAAQTQIATDVGKLIGPKQMIGLVTEQFSRLGVIGGHVMSRVTDLKESGQYTSGQIRGKDVTTPQNQQEIERLISEIMTYTMNNALAAKHVARGDEQIPPSEFLMKGLSRGDKSGQSAKKQIDISDIMAEVKPGGVFEGMEKIDARLKNSKGMFSSLEEFLRFLHSLIIQADRLAGTAEKGKPANLKKIVTALEPLYSVTRRSAEGEKGKYDPDQLAYVQEATGMAGMSPEDYLRFIVGTAEGRKSTTTGFVPDLIKSAMKSTSGGGMGVLGGGPQDMARQLMGLLTYAPVRKIPEEESAKGTAGIYEKFSDTIGISALDTKVYSVAFDAANIQKMDEYVNEIATVLAHEITHRKLADNNLEQFGQSLYNTEPAFKDFIVGLREVDPKRYGAGGKQDLATPAGLGIAAHEAVARVSAGQGLFGAEKDTKFVDRLKSIADKLGVFAEIERAKSSFTGKAGYDVVKSTFENTPELDYEEMIGRAAKRGKAAEFVRSMGAGGPLLSKEDVPPGGKGPHGKIDIQQDVVTKMLFEEGKTISEVAKQLGVSARTVARRLAEWGIDLKGARDATKKLYKDGMEKSFDLFTGMNAEIARMEQEPGGLDMNAQLAKQAAAEISAAQGEALRSGIGKTHDLGTGAPDMFATTQEAVDAASRAAYSQQEYAQPAFRRVDEMDRALAAARKYRRMGSPEEAIASTQTFAPAVGESMALLQGVETPKAARSELTRMRTALLEMGEASEKSGIRNPNLMRLWEEYRYAELNVVANQAKALRSLIQELETKGEAGKLTKEEANRLPKLYKELDRVNEEFLLTIERSLEKTTAIVKSHDKVLLPEFQNLGGRELRATPSAGTLKGEDMFDIAEARAVGVDDAKSVIDRFREIFKIATSEKGQNVGGFLSTVIKGIEDDVNAKRYYGKSTPEQLDQSELLLQLLNKINKEFTLLGPKAISQGIKLTPDTLRLLEPGAQSEMQMKGIEHQEDLMKRSGLTQGTADFKIVDESGRSIKRFRVELNAVKTGLDSAGKATYGFKRNWVDLDKQMAASRGFGQSLRRVIMWGSAAGLVYGSVRVFRQMFDVIRNTEYAVKQLAVVMNTTETDFGALRDAAVGFAKDFGTPINQVTDAMLVFAQQGLNQIDVLDRTRTSIIAANISTLKSAEATEALTSAAKQYSVEGESSIKFLDAWVNVERRHAITVENLTEALMRAASAAKVAGITFDELNGLVAAIGSVTRQSGKEIGTSIRFMTQRIRIPKAQQELRKIGVSSLGSTGDLKDVPKILDEVHSKWNKLTNAQKLSIAQAVGGVRHYNSFIVLMNNYQEYLDATTDSITSQGAAHRANASIMDSVTKKIESLKSSASGLAIQFGDVMLGPLKAVVDILKSLVSGFAALPSPIKTGAIALAGFAIAGLKAGRMYEDFASYLGAGTLSSVKTGLIDRLRHPFRGFTEGIDDEAVELADRSKSFVGMAGGGILSRGQGRLGIGGGIGGGQGAFLAKGTKLGLLSQFGAGGSIKDLNSLIIKTKQLGDFGKAGELSLNKLKFALNGVRSGAVSSAGAMTMMNTVTGKMAVGAGALALNFGPLLLIIAAVAATVYVLSKAYSYHNRTGESVSGQIKDEVQSRQDAIAIIDQQIASYRSLSAMAQKAADVQERYALHPDEFTADIKKGTYESPLLIDQQRASAEAKFSAQAGVYMPGLIDVTVDSMGKLQSVTAKTSSQFSTLADQARKFAEIQVFEAQTKAIEAFVHELIGATTWWGKLFQIKQTPFEKMTRAAEILAASQGRRERGLITESDKKAAKEYNETFGQTVVLLGKIDQLISTMPEMPPQMALAKLQEEVFKGRLPQLTELSNLTRGRKDITESGYQSKVGLQALGIKFAGFTPEETKEMAAKRGLTPYEGKIGQFVAEKGDLILSEGMQGFVDEFNGDKYLHYFSTASQTWVRALLSSFDGASAVIIKGGKQIGDDMQAEIDNTFRILTGAGTGTKFRKEVNLGAMFDFNLSGQQRAAFEDVEMAEFIFQASELDERLTKLQEEMLKLPEGEDDTNKSKVDTFTSQMLTLGESFGSLAHELKVSSDIIRVTESFYKLKSTLEETAFASEKARASEEIRRRVMSETVGALSGVDTASVDLGKFDIDLTPLERAFKESPGLGKGINQLTERTDFYLKQAQTASEMGMDLQRYLETTAKQGIKVDSKAITAGLASGDIGAVPVVDAITKSGDTLHQDLVGLAVAMSDTLPENLAKAVQGRAGEIAKSGKLDIAGKRLLTGQDASFVLRDALAQSPNLFGVQSVIPEGGEQALLALAAEIQKQGGTVKPEQFKDIKDLFVVGLRKEDTRLNREYRSETLRGVPHTTDNRQAWRENWKAVKGIESGEQDAAIMGLLASLFQLVDASKKTGDSTDQFATDLSLLDSQLDAYSMSVLASIGFTQKQAEAYARENKLRLDSVRATLRMIDVFGGLAQSFRDIAYEAEKTRRTAFDTTSMDKALGRHPLSARAPQVLQSGDKLEFGKLGLNQFQQEAEKMKFEQGGMSDNQRRVLKFQEKEAVTAYEQDMENKKLEGQIQQGQRALETLESARHKIETESPEEAQKIERLMDMIKSDLSKAGDITGRGKQQEYLGFNMDYYTQEMQALFESIEMPTAPDPADTELGQAMTAALNPVVNKQQEVVTGQQTMITNQQTQNNLLTELVTIQKDLASFMWGGTPPPNTTVPITTLPIQPTTGDGGILGSMWGGTPPPTATPSFWQEAPPVAPANMLAGGISDYIVSDLLTKGLSDFMWGGTPITTPITSIMGQPATALPTFQPLLNNTTTIDGNRITGVGDYPTLPLVTPETIDQVSAGGEDYRGAMRHYKGDIYEEAKSALMMPGKDRTADQSKLLDFFERGNSPSQVAADSAKQVETAQNRVVDATEKSQAVLQEIFGILKGGASEFGKTLGEALTGAIETLAASNTGTGAVGASAVDTETFNDLLNSFTVAQADLEALGGTQTVQYQELSNVKDTVTGAVDRLLLVETAIKDQTKGHDISVVTRDLKELKVKMDRILSEVTAKISSAESKIHHVLSRANK